MEFGHFSFLFSFSFSVIYFLSFRFFSIWFYFFPVLSFALLFLFYYPPCLLLRYTFFSHIFLLFCNSDDNSQKEKEEIHQQPNLYKWRKPFYIFIYLFISLLAFCVPVCLFVCVYKKYTSFNVTKAYHIPSSLVRFRFARATFRIINKTDRIYT